METIILLSYISSTNLLIGNLWFYNNVSTSVIIANVYVSNCQTSFCNGTLIFSNNELISNNIDNFVVIGINGNEIYYTNGLEAKVCDHNQCKNIGNASIHGRLVVRYYNIGANTYTILNDQKTIFVMNSTSISRYTSPTPLCNWFWPGDEGLYITHTSSNNLLLLGNNATTINISTYPVNCPRYFEISNEKYYMDSNYMIMKGENSTGVTMLLANNLIILEDSEKLIFETAQGIFVTDMNFSPKINITTPLHVVKYNSTSFISYTDSMSNINMDLIIVYKVAPTPLSTPLSAPIFAPLSTPISTPLSSTPTSSIISPVSQSDDNILAIVIPTVIGVIVVVAGIVISIVFIRKRRHRRKKTSVATNKLTSSDSDDLVLGSLLGSGSYGQVYEAIYHKSKVAVKVSNDSSISEEIDLLINLKPHPHVVRVFGSAKKEDKYMLIMEYCNGGSCNDYIEKHHPSMDTKVKWIKEIISGLIHLHESNIIHRDIAARNILIDRDVAKISDLGFARKLDIDTGATKSNIGPLRWMAPESIKDRKYSRQTDIWMLGILIYEIIAEAEPYWNSPDIIDVISKVRDNGLMLPLDDIDDKWKNIIRMCCKYHPNERVDLSTLYNIIDS